MMAAPAVTATTEAVYAEVPEHQRTADEPLGWPLLRYLALLGDQAQEIVDLQDELTSGVMGRPEEVPAGWLPWLAQFVGLDIEGLTVPEIRQGIAGADSLQAGSEASLRETIEALLGGEKRYILDLHAGGDPFAIAVYANVDDAGGATWDSLALQYPSWGAWDEAASWDDLFTLAPVGERPNLRRVIPAWVLFTLETLTDGHVWLFLERTIETWSEWEAHFADWDQFETEVFPWQ